MKIDDKTVDKIASLSKLTLEEVDTEGVEPLIHMTEDVNVLRADDAIVDITQKEALKNAPKKDSTYFKIPKVVAR